MASGSYAAMPEDRRRQFRERTREAAQELCADEGLELTPELVFRVRLSVLDVGAAQDVEAVASEHLAAEETERIVAELRNTTA